MKVLMCHRVGGAFGYITDSWCNALADKGHDVRRWDGATESWHSFDPDLYIGCSGHKQLIPERRRAKIAIHVNPYGPFDIHGISESPANIRWVAAQQPDCVFGYGQAFEFMYWEYWTSKLSIPWIPMPTAGDKTIYKPTPQTDKTQDVVYLGGRWAYKGKTIDTYLMPVIENTEKVMVHGWGEWPDGISAGILPEQDVSNFLGSGKVGPCIAEIHTHEYGFDIPERAFKVGLCNTLIVHDNVKSIKRMIPSAIVADSPTDFMDLIRYYISDEATEDRIRITEKQRDEVLSHHTYHNRMAELFKGLGWHDEAIKMLA
jgi:hypothetical protein